MEKGTDLLIKLVTAIVHSEEPIEAVVDKYVKCATPELRAKLIEKLWVKREEWKALEATREGEAADEKKQPGDVWYELRQRIQKDIGITMLKESSRNDTNPSETLTQATSTMIIIVGSFIKGFYKGDDRLKFAELFCKGLMLLLEEKKQENGTPREGQGE